MAATVCPAKFRSWIVVLLIVAGFIASLNATVRLLVAGTLIEPMTGATETTVGGVPSVIGVTGVFISAWISETLRARL